MTGLAPRHWTLAAMTALALHAGAAAVLWESAADGSAAAAGVNGLAVSLGPAGFMPAGLALPVGAPEDAASVSPATADAQVAETPETLPVDTIAAEAAAAPLPEPVPAEAAAEIIPPDTEQVAVAEIPEAVAEPVPEPFEAPSDLPEPPPEKPEPPIQLAALPEAATPLDRTAIEAQAPPAAGPAKAAGPGAGGATRAGDAGDDHASPEGELASLKDDYGATLTAWIQKFHKFPRRLERRKIYGTAIVSFTIDRAGNLLNYEIVRSSGDELIDEAAIETLRRASPMPPVPRELPGAAYTPLPLPIQFNPPS